MSFPLHIYGIGFLLLFVANLPITNHLQTKAISSLKAWPQAADYRLFYCLSFTYILKYHSHSMVEGGFEEMS